ncbi:MAG: hypothetical protein ACJ0QP_05285 [Schleiferiaceae bacterium]
MVYFDYPFGGGNIGNSWVKSVFSDATVIYLENSSFSEYIKTLKKIRGHYDVIILNGLLAFPLALFLRTERIYVVNHNLENYIFDNTIKKFLVNRLQKFVNKKAKIRYFFNSKDARSLGIDSYEIIKPVWGNFEISKTLISSYGDYDYVIPCNFSYLPNIEGLIYFYQKCRVAFSGKRIVITSPKSLDDERLYSELNIWNDIAVSLSKECYLALLTYKRVLLPVYRGSGIQIKALEALHYNTSNVYASNFIRESDKRFFNFLSLDEICTSCK